MDAVPPDPVIDLRRKIMKDPRRASLRVLALLTFTCLAAALTAESAYAKPKSSNGKIVFQSTQGGDGFTNDIYVMDADGKRETRLTDDPGDDVLAVWSPQGDKIAFLSDRRGNGYEIYVMNADGGNQRPLREEAPVCPFSFVWSPDGTRLAYSDGTDVYVAKVNGTQAPVNVSIYKPFDSTDKEPSWSPDGSRLVVRNITPCLGCSDLHIVNAADGGRFALSTGPGFDEAPRWSPAGDLIAYEGDRGERGLYVTAADGTGTETLVSGAVGSFGPAEWSFDGTRLAFRSMEGTSVHVVNANGSGLMRLRDSQSSMGNIFWSPDGSKVGFHDTNAKGWVDIFVVNADGTGRRSAANYTKTRAADEFAYGWQKLPTQ
jgi:TolB protein